MISIDGHGMDEMGYLEYEIAHYPYPGGHLSTVFSPYRAVRP
jgi:hypothetical protein